MNQGYGGLLGGGLPEIGGLGIWQQQQQQQLLQQWQSVPTYSGSANTTNTYVVASYPVEAVPLKTKGPETALEWLDRRVDEVRLPLAA